MPDENDLRAACTTLAQQAPTIDDAAHVIPSEPQRRGRTPLILAGVAAATAAAVAVPTSLGVLRTDAPTASTPADEFTVYRAFDLAAPAGWREEGRTVFDTGQSVALSGPNDGKCSVRVLEAGQFDTSRIPPGSGRLTVDGRPGYFAEITNPYDLTPLSTGNQPGVRVTREPSGQGSDGSSPERAKRWTVAWQYDEKAWALSICEVKAGIAEVRRQEELLANATTFGTATQHVPMRLGYVPAGFEPVIAGVRDPRISGGFKYDYDLSFKIPGNAGRDSSVFIAYLAGDRLDQISGTPITVNGRPAWNDGRHLVIQGNGFQALVMAPYGLPGDERSELIRIAESLEFAPHPMDTTTWFDGAHALP